jgi:hypothetical protein
VVSDDPVDRDETPAERPARRMQAVSDDDQETQRRSSEQRRTVEEWRAAIPAEAPARLPSPARRPRSEWDDARRAAAGAAYRKPGGDGMTDSERDRRRTRSHPFGVPIADHVERELGGPGEVLGREVTGAVALLRRELDPEDLEHVQRLKRDSDIGSPLEALWGANYRLSKELERLKRDDWSANKHQADAIIELLAHPPHQAVSELQEDVQRIWRAVAEIGKHLGTPHTESRGKGTVWESVHRSQTLHRWGVWLAGIALTSALGTVGYVIASIRASGAEEVLRAQDRQNIKDLEQENKNLWREVQRLKDKTP